MSRALLLLVLCGGCLGPGRQLVEAPLVARGLLPATVGDVALTVSRAEGGVGALVLDDAEGAVIGAWPAAAGADWLRGTELADLSVYEGEATVAHHAVLGTPSLLLEGSVVAGGRAVPFRLRLDERLEISAPVILPVDARTPPTSFLWTLDLGVVLGAVPWDTPPGTDGVLQVGDGLGDALRAGITDPAAWSLTIAGVDTDPLLAD
ncbi:MAG: hypothetical protein H6732_07000 [Alphaproteobacteria bacterium]|nr:hypothetical protein [Alphaproteobacteria bacterium]